MGKGTATVYREFRQVSSVVEVPLVYGRGVPLVWVLPFTFCYIFIYRYPYPLLLQRVIDDYMCGTCFKMAYFLRLDFSWKLTKWKLDIPIKLKVYNVSTSLPHYTCIFHNMTNKKNLTYVTELSFDVSEVSFFFIFGTNYKSYKY